MKYIDINKKLEKIIVFSTNELKLLDNEYNKYKTNSWLKKGYIKNIRKGYYIYNDISINENILYLIANKSYSPSYISFESALSYYNLIPEMVYSVTSVSSKKTLEFNFKNTTFSYRKINPKLFFGYKRVNFGENIFLIADIEKVLLDYLYFRKDINDIEDLKGLRLNKIELKQKVNIEKLNKYCDCYNKIFLRKKVNLLIKYIEG